MTLLEARQAVETIVGHYLGTYSNGDLAITTGEPRADLNATGVECIVEGLPDYEVRKTFGQDSHLRKIRSIRFLAHDDEGMKNMEPIIEDLTVRYPTASIVRIGYQPSSQFSPQFVITFEKSARIV